MVTADSITADALYLALMNHISTSEEYLRVRRLQDSGKLEDGECWIIVNVITGEIRIADKCAWLDDDEDIVPFVFNANLRGHDVENYVSNAIAELRKILSDAREGK